VKVGDEVKLETKPEYGTGKIVRFYSQQGTVMVQFENVEGCTYCSPWNLVRYESR